MPSLEAVRSLILESSVADWNLIRTPPFFEHRLGEVIAYEDGKQHHYLEHSTHDYVAVYVPDVALRMAFGLDTNDSRDWRPEWAKFADDKVAAQYVDTFWNGALVDRNVVIAVDGSRALMPDPRAFFVDMGDLNYETIGNTVSSSNVALARLLDGIMGHDLFDLYLKGTGFIVVD